MGGGQHEGCSFLVCGILNKCNPFTYLLLLKVVTSLNKEKITTKVLKFAIRCSHRYLKKKKKSRTGHKG